MRRFVIPALAVTLVAVVMAFRPAAEDTFSASDLEGAWKAVHVHAALQDTTWSRDEDRPNMVVFSDGYWASLRIAGDGTRAELPEDPTDEQLLEAWRPFIASGGSYTVSGTTISATTLIAKNPNQMGEEWDSEFKFDGDKLVRQFSNPENGNTWIVTFERM